MDREANRHRNMSKVYNGTNQITRIVLLLIAMRPERAMEHALVQGGRTRITFL